MPIHFRPFKFHLVLPFVALALSACGGGGTTSGSTTAYTLGGTVASLSTNGLILANGSANTVSVPTGASTFAFNTTQTGSYDVTIFQQPAGQTCSVSNGTGSGGTAVGTVAVQCRAYGVFVANDLGSSISQFSVASDRTLTAAATPTVTTPHRPNALAISSDGTHAWVGYDNDSLITDLLVSSSGQLTLSGSTTAASNTNGLALSPNDAHLYSGDYANQTVSQFTIGTGGLATPISPAQVAAGSGPYATVVTPDGKHVYVANSFANTISCYSVGSSGALTTLSTGTIGTTTYGTTPKGLAIDPNGNYLYVTLSNSNKIVAYSIDPSTGTLTFHASQATGSSPIGVAVRPGGTYAYVANSGSGTVSQYTLAGGLITLLSTQTIPAGTTPTGIAFSPDSGSLYVTNNGDSTVSEYTIDSGTGQLISIGTVATGLGPTAIVVR